MKDAGSVKKEWQEVSAAVAEGMLAWRKQHPKATLREIEKELDLQLAQLRAKMLEDAALLSEKREWVDGSDGTPTCPECGAALKGQSREERHLQTHGEKSIRIERQYGVCPKCGQGFFPPG
jgi:YgiT-type zinc finger domain-containing protein